MSFGRIPIYDLDGSRYIIWTNRPWFANSGRLHVTSVPCAIGAWTFLFGLVKKVKDGVRLLGNGKLTSKVTIRVVGATETAKKAVEKAGGELIVEPIKKTVLVKGQKTSKKEAKKPVKKAKKTK